MREQQPFHSSTFGYTVVALIVGLVTAVIFTPIGTLLTRKYFPELPRTHFEPTHSTIPPTSDVIDYDNHQRNNSQVAPEEKNQPTTTRVESLHRQETMLTMEYDSLASRLSAINDSLTQRARDLGGLPVKPEIIASLETSRSDLAAAWTALQNRNWDAAESQMARVKTALKYLESL